MEEAVRRKPRGISPVWILPILAILLGCWLAYRSLSEAGINVQVSFNNATGIVAGKTQVMFKGIPVGLVTGVQVDPTMKNVIVDIEMVRESENKLVEDLQFYIVRPEVSASRITGLDTLLAGSYIGVIPGKSTVLASKFVGLDSMPPLPADTPGLRLILEADSTMSLEVRSPIKFRNIQVGEVASVDLTDDGSKVKIGVLIYEEYTHLVNDTTVFWNSSGILFEASLTRVKVKLDSLAALMSGGLTFSSLSDGGPIDRDRIIKLYEDEETALLSRGTRLVFHFPDTEGVNRGAAIRYKGTTVGEITEVRLQKDMRSLVAVGFARKGSENLFRDATQVWRVSPRISLSGIDNVGSAIGGSYLAVEPGGEGIQHEFDVVDHPPISKTLDKGVTVIVQARRPGSLKPGSPVTFRQMEVGRIMHLELSPDSRLVNIYVGIEKKYAPLLRTTTRFWNVSGFTVSGGVMTEMTVKTESIKALVAGGIALAVPSKEVGEQVQSMHRYSMSEKPPEGYQDWNPGIWIDGSSHPVEPVGMEKDVAPSQKTKKKHTIITGKRLEKKK